MALAHYQDTVFNNTTGRPLGGCVVRVYSYPGNVLQPIFSDPSGTPLSSLITGDEQNLPVGLYEFYIDDGAYDIEFVYNGTIVERLTNVPIYNPENTALAGFVTQTSLDAQLADNTAAAAIGTANGDSVQETLDKLSDSRPFTDFLPSPYLGTDVSAAIVAAAVWSAANSKYVDFVGTFPINNTPTITTAGVRFNFENVIFNVADSGAKGTITNLAQAPMGFLFKNAASPSIKVGHCVINGTTAIGATALIGMNFDHCDDVHVEGGMHFTNMSLGLSLLWSSGHIGRITGNNMYGVQAYSGTGTAGSLVNTVGCYDLVMDSMDCKNCYKPVLYCSVAIELGGAKLDTRNCTFGMITGTGLSILGAFSDESSVLSIRSAKNCTFLGAYGTDVSRVLNIQRYSTDAGFSVDGNIITIPSGSFVSTGGSGDVGFHIVTESEAIAPIGKNKFIGNGVYTGDAACEYAMLIGSGDIEIESIDLSGAVRGMLVYDAKVVVNNARISGAQREAVHFGNGANVDIRNLEIASGPVVSGIHAVTSLAVGASPAPPNVDVGRMTYNRRNAPNDYGYMIFSSTLGYSSIRCRDIRGKGTAEQIRFVGSFYETNLGDLIGTVAPATGTTHLDDVMFLKNPATGAATQVRCSRGGTNTVFSTTGTVDIGIDARKVTFASVTGRAVGEYFTIAGVSGIKQITEINGFVVTVDVACSATVTGAAVANALPIYRTEGIAQMSRGAASLTTYTAPTGGATIDTETRASLGQMKAIFDDFKAKLVAGNIAT